MKRLDGPIFIFPRSLGDLPPDEAGSRHFSELECISIYLKDGEQKVSKTNMSHCDVFITKIEFKSLF